MKFQLEPYHRNVPDEELLADLQSIAAKVGKNSVTAQEYMDSGGQYSPCTYQRRFGSWLKALAAAELEKTRNLGVTDIEYFDNLAAVWERLGKQPRYKDMVKPDSKYVAGAYDYRFGSWRGALAAFVEHMDTQDGGSPQFERLVAVGPSVPLAPRSINYRLRFLVMRRDNFKCQQCGKSPATDAGVLLEVDHVKAWSKGGETVIDNLQTLCWACNRGKSDLDAR